MMNEFLLDLLPELIGSLVGALTGFLLGMLLVKNARIEDEEERKEDMIKSLIAEITDNKRELDKGPQKFSDRSVSPDIILSTDALDSAIFSGGYQLLTVETQRFATCFFNGCKRMNQLIEQLEFIVIKVDLHLSKEGRQVRHKIMKLYFRLKEAAGDILSSLEEELGALPDTPEVDGQLTVRKTGS